MSEQSALAALEPTLGFASDAALGPLDMVRHLKVEPGTLPIRFGAFHPDGTPIAGAALRRATSGNIWSEPDHAAEVLEATAVYGGILLPHFGHFLLETLARYWFLRHVPDLPIRLVAKVA